MGGLTVSQISKEAVQHDEPLDLLMAALSEETLHTLATLADAEPGVAEWAVAKLGPGARLALLTYDAIEVVPDADPESEPGVRILTLGHELIKRCDVRFGDVSEQEAFLRRSVEDALAPAESIVAQ